MLGALFSILSAAAFALNNASARRGVISGTPIQAMAISVPLGVVCFLPIAWIVGEFGRLAQFPLRAAGWMAGVGLLHFICGRYLNFKANQVAGTNLTAPVIQLQAVVTMVLAVIILHEPCTLLQAFGGVVMVAGSLITQRQPPRSVATAMPSAPTSNKASLPPFIPLYLAGYVFASGAALAYGTSPIMARFALAHTGPSTGILGGLIAYVTATTVLGLVFLASPSLRRNAKAMQRSNAWWFVFSGVLVAAAQGFFFCAVALAPVLFVMPLLQTSLAFRMLFSSWLSPHHEVFGPLVVGGVVISLFGAMLVSMDSGFIVGTLALPDSIARVLLWRV